jgi:hypothetical protein
MIGRIISHVFLGDIHTQVIVLHGSVAASVVATGHHARALVHQLATGHSRPVGADPVARLGALFRYFAWLAFHG